MDYASELSKISSWEIPMQTSKEELYIRFGSIQVCLPDFFPIWH
jgi:hypothetical protein